MELAVNVVVAWSVNSCLRAHFMIPGYEITKISYEIFHKVRKL